MNPHASAAVAYGQAQSPIRTDRSAEYETFASVTRALINAQKSQNTNFSEFVQALQNNRKLWTHLAASVADADNGLDQDLRARIFYLAEFTDQHTRKILRKEATPDILLEINSGMMRGLSSPAVAA